MNVKRNTILYCTDKGFLDCSIVSAYSIVRNASRPLDLLFLHNGLGVSELEKMDRLKSHHNVKSLKACEVDYGDFSHKPMGQLPVATCGRLLAKKYTPPSFLYIDGDTLCTTDICPLLDQDIDGKPIGAIQDMLFLSWHQQANSGRIYNPKRHQNILDRHSRHFKKFNATKYFNAGVLIFDYQAVSSLGLDGKIANLEAASKYPLSDQDHLNEIFVDNVFWLDPKWNAQWSNIWTARKYMTDATTEYYKNSRERPAVIHYTGSMKPWIRLDRKNIKKLLGLQQIPELRRMLAMRRQYKMATKEAETALGLVLFNEGQ